MAKNTVSRKSTSPRTNKAEVISTANKIPDHLSHLFRAGTSFDTPECLPFVKNLGPNKGRDFWSVPPTVDYSDACMVGTLYGAAALIYSRNTDDNFTIRWAIFAAVEKGKDALKNGNKGYLVGFLAMIEKAISEGSGRYSDETIAQVAASSVAMGKAIAMQVEAQA